MSQREIDVSQIIDAMNLNSSVNSIFGGRIFFGEPRTEQTNIYMMINIVTKPIVEESHAMVRLECRFVGGDVNKTIHDLIDAKNIVSNYFESTKKFGTFSVYKITEGGNMFNGLDIKERNVVGQDYFFYFTKY